MDAQRRRFADEAESERASFCASAVAGRNILMVLTDREDDICVAESDDELLTFDVLDYALGRAAPIVAGQATSVTLVYGTNIVGNCGCAVAKHANLDRVLRRAHIRCQKSLNRSWLNSV